MKPLRSKLQWRLDLEYGDRIDFIVDPYKNHDCDGVYIADIEIWPNGTSAKI